MEGDSKGHVKDQLTRAEMLDILQSRASSYTFLSTAYRQEVSAAFLEVLVNELTGGAEPEPESKGHRLLRDYARRIREADLRQVEIDLGAEYIALLLAASANPVFPYESVYTSPERLLMQQARDEVLAEYRGEHLARLREFKHPEDHIAIELEFMAYLCQKTADALEEGDVEAALAALEKQKGFLDRHLLVWVPRFCQDLAQVARSDFYRAIALLTQEHLAMEPDTVNELLEAVA
jgi:TorA maturation chaperone TorD